MKSVKEVLTKAKGAGNEGKTVTGKGSFSKAGFAERTNAYVNDTTHKVKVMGKDGKETSVNLSELIRADLKKTVANAKYPQKSELAVLDTCEISTAGMAEAIPYLVREEMRIGKKFDIPATGEMGGSIYLAPVKGKTKTVQVRDIKSKEELGTTTITTKDSVQIRAKSPVPKHLQTKVRKDKNGNVVK